MSNPEIVEQIRQLNLVINNALGELDKGQDIDFFKALIQQNAIQIYQRSTLLEHSAQTKPAEIKIIRHEQVVPDEKPVINEPVAHETSRPEPEVHETKAEVPSVQPQATPVEQKPVEPVPAPVSQPKTNLEPIVDELKDLSLNDKISKNKQPVLNVSEKSKEMPIKDLVKAISIGKKFEFINDLFDGNSEVYKSTLHTVQHASSYEEASSYLEAIVSQYEWSSNDHLAAEFFALVKRRFL
jgi:hypothetical protein